MLVSFGPLTPVETRFVASHVAQPGGCLPPSEAVSSARLGQVYQL